MKIFVGLIISREMFFLSFLASISRLVCTHSAIVNTFLPSLTEKLKTLFQGNEWWGGGAVLVAVLIYSGLTRE